MQPGSAWWLLFYSLLGPVEYVRDLWDQHRESKNVMESLYLVKRLRIWLIINLYFMEELSRAKSPVSCSFDRDAQ